MSRFRQCTVGLAVLLSLASPRAARSEAETIQFPSEDGLLITADVYWTGRDPQKSLPFICLFHQVGYSRAEYAEIAPRLVKLGYNCMAVDLRVGRVVHEVFNETAARAIVEGKDPGTDFIRAYPDVVASLKYARDNFAEGKLIGWGSSYSGMLLFKANADHEGLLDGILAFSPNDLSKWSRSWLPEAVEKVDFPVFLTSMRRERDNWKRMQQKLPEEQVTVFVPVSAGRHGSSALWSSTRDHDLYWPPVQEFLATHFPPIPATADGISQGQGIDDVSATQDLIIEGVAPFPGVPNGGDGSTGQVEVPHDQGSGHGHGGGGHGGDPK